MYEMWIPKVINRASDPEFGWLTQEEPFDETPGRAWRKSAFPVGWEQFDYEGYCPATAVSRLVKEGNSTRMRLKPAARDDRFIEQQCKLRADVPHETHFGRKGFWQCWQDEPLPPGWMAL